MSDNNTETLAMDNVVIEETSVEAASENGSEKIPIKEKIAYGAGDTQIRLESLQ